MGKDARPWDIWKATISVGFENRDKIYFMNEGNRFKAITIVLPKGLQHDIQSNAEFMSLNRKFPSAMNQEWRQYEASKQYVIILIDSENIEDLVLDPDKYSWQFPIVAPSNAWPINTGFYLIFCRNYNPCTYPDMPAEEIVAQFPIQGPSREDYLALIENDDSNYFLGGAARRQQPFLLFGRSFPPTFLAETFWVALVVLMLSAIGRWL